MISGGGRWGGGQLFRLAEGEGGNPEKRG
jgi:hypothetical protein